MLDNVGELLHNSGMKARSRLAHNKNKQLIKGIGGTYYAHTSKTIIRGYLGINALILVSCLCFYIFGLQFKSEETTDLISPYVTPYISTTIVEAKEEPKPVFKNNIEAYIYEVFGEDYDDAMKVLECENRGLNPNAINHNRNGSIDEGIFQINSIHKQPNMQDYKANIDYAYKIFKRQGWSPWSCSHKVGVTPFYLK